MMLDISILYTPSKFLSNNFAGVENHVDPDQLASHKPADLDLQCFQNRI